MSRREEYQREDRGCSRLYDILHNGLHHIRESEYAFRNRDVKSITDNLDHALIIEEGSLRSSLYQALIAENFKIINLPFRPTAENLAKYIYEILAKTYDVECVDVYETPNNCASYNENNK